MPFCHREACDQSCSHNPLRQSRTSHVVCLMLRHRNTVRDVRTVEHTSRERVGRSDLGSEHAARCNPELVVRELEGIAARGPDLCPRSPRVLRRVCILLVLVRLQLGRDHRGREELQRARGGEGAEQELVWQRLRGEAVGARDDGGGRDEQLQTLQPATERNTRTCIVGMASEGVA